MRQPQPGPARLGRCCSKQHCLEAQRRRKNEECMPSKEADSDILSNQRAQRRRKSKEYVPSKKTDADVRATIKLTQLRR